MLLSAFVEFWSLTNLFFLQQQGLQIEIQGTDLSEVAQEEVLAKCQLISK
jgi:hypothetical protein